MLSRIDRWRLDRDERRFWRKQSRMFREADVVVVSHTKSGRTWLRVMLSHLCHLAYGAPVDELLRFDNFHAIAPAIPRVHFTRDTRFSPDPAHGSPFGLSERQKLVILLRDPRDVAVSFYFQVRHRASARALARKGIPETARELPIFEFVSHPSYGVPRVIDHFNRWRKEARGFREVCVVHYEDLRARPQEELLRVARFVGLDVTAEQVAAAVRFADFDRLKQKEQSGFFRSGRLAPADPGNPDSFKVRQGEVGGYRRHFTAEQCAMLDALVASRLERDEPLGTAS